MANPLDRTWYNTLVDDDGSGTTGTVWNKTAVDSLLDSVDASLAVGVDKTGTPAANQVAVFADADTIQGSPAVSVDLASGALALTGAFPFITLHNSAPGSTQQPAFRFVNNAEVLYVMALAGPAGGEIQAITVTRVGTNVAGVLALGGGQLKFPPTALPSTDPTTFDDYREVNFTPFLSASGGASGQSYVTQAGRCIKKGKEVSGWASIQVSAPGTFTGGVRIGGLPFVGGSGFSYVTSPMLFFNLNTAIAAMQGIIGQGLTYMDLYYVPAAGAGSVAAVPGSMIAAGTVFHLQFSYEAAT